MSGEALRVLQIGANASDLPGVVRLFADAFGFRNAGGTMLWGQTIGVQGLPPDSRAAMWWMVGAQEFFQLEFFHHTRPPQRPKRPDWRACDLGWVRFGIAVADFDGCMEALAGHGVAPITAPLVEAQGRRAAFVEPYTQSIVEVIETARASDGPGVVYATSSVSDLEAARGFYREVLGFEILDHNHLHDGRHEALWGLEGAASRSFLARGAGDVLIEIVRYDDPAGRPRPEDYRASDQGIVNLCVGGRSDAAVTQALARAQAAGLHPPQVLSGGGAVCGYLTAPEREIELSAIPQAADAGAGFVATRPFFG